MNWVLAAQFTAAVLGALGVGQIVTAIAKRRSNRADAVARINKVTLEWAEQLKVDAAEARVQAREARREAAEARTETAETRREVSATLRLVRELRADVTSMTEYVQRVVTAIRDPSMTIEQLRIMVDNAPPPVPPPRGNGAP